jgi:hypothetical protein
MTPHHSANQQTNYTDFPQTDTREMHCMMECMSICTACAKKCIEEGHARTAALCAECADICALAIKSKSCQSEFQHQILDLCAQACRRCAEECSHMNAHHCQECAEVCRRCADCCTPVSSYH